MAFFSAIDARDRQQALYDAANAFLRGSNAQADLEILGLANNSIYNNSGGSTYSLSNSVGSPTLGTNTRCSVSSDCGAGYFCSNGRCVPSGTGNTNPIFSGSGCSTGPGDPTNNSGNTCGSSSGTGNRGGCYVPGCGSGAPGYDCTGDRCCRFTAFGVTCSYGRCPDSDPNISCSEYCSNYRDSYGTLGPGCPSGASCDECSVCNNGSCQPKSKEEAPCHCFPDPGDRCDRTDEPLTCCSYRDTCAGRKEGLYCHPTYRTWYPRCYDPDYPCDTPEPDLEDCATCQDYTKLVLPGEDSSIPEGCYQTGFIEVGAGGPYPEGTKTLLYRCCTDNGCGNINCGQANPPPDIAGSGNNFVVNPCYNYVAYGISYQKAFSSRCTEPGTGNVLPVNWGGSEGTSEITVNIPSSYPYVTFVVEGPTSSSFYKDCPPPAGSDALIPTLDITGRVYVEARNANGDRFYFTDIFSYRKLIAIGSVYADNIARYDYAFSTSYGLRINENSPNLDPTRNLPQKF